MDRTPENLGLAPDLSRVSSEVRDLIRHGSRDGHVGGSEVAVAVCKEMFRAGYAADEIWIVLTDPANGISTAFFEKDG